MVARVVSEREREVAGSSEGQPPNTPRSETVCWICGIPLESRKALGPDASGDYMCPRDDWQGCRDRADGVAL